jgi:hypothetical protein
MPKRITNTGIPTVSASCICEHLLRRIVDQRGRVGHHFPLSRLNHDEKRALTPCLSCAVRIAIRCVASPGTYLQIRFVSVPSQRAREVSLAAPASHSPISILRRASKALSLRAASAASSRKAQICKMRARSPAANASSRAGITIAPNTTYAPGVCSPMYAKFAS